MTPTHYDILEVRHNGGVALTIEIPELPQG